MSGSHRHSSPTSVATVGSAQRFLRPKSAGVMRWLTQPVCERREANERQVFEQILFGPDRQSVDTAKLAQATGLDAKQVAKALFSLNRERSIAVDVGTGYADSASRNWSALILQMSAMAQRLIKKSMVLADPEGLCIASVGTLDEMSQTIAARCREQNDGDDLHRVALHICGLTFTLSTFVPVSEQDPEWVPIVRSLHNLSHPLMGTLTHLNRGTPP